MGKISGYTDDVVKRAIRYIAEHGYCPDRWLMAELVRAGYAYEEELGGVKPTNKGMRFAAGKR